MDKLYKEDNPKVSYIIIHIVLILGYHFKNWKVDWRVHIILLERRETSVLNTETVFFFHNCLSLKLPVTPTSTCSAYWLQGFYSYIHVDTDRPYLFKHSFKCLVTSRSKPFSRGFGFQLFTTGFSHFCHFTRFFCFPQEFEIVRFNCIYG